MNTDIELNTIYNEDCLETMKRMPDNFVDLVVTSPPYNMRTRVRNGSYTERERSEHFSKKYAHFDDALPIEEYYRLHKEVLSELLRVSPLVFVNIQLVTGSKEAWFKLIGDFGTYIKDVLVWDKSPGQPAMHGDVINRGFELILALQNPPTAGRAFKTKYFQRGEMNDVWRVGRASVTPGHGAVFPKKLVNKILLGWSKVGDTVYDPFNGSGTTTRAAKDLNRNYIGSEISKEYCEIAEDRLKQEVLL